MVHVNQKAHLLCRGGNCSLLIRRWLNFVTEKGNGNAPEPFALEPKIDNYFQIEPSEKPCDPFIIVLRLLSSLNVLVCSFC